MSKPRTRAWREWRATLQIQNAAGPLDRMSVYAKESYRKLDRSRRSKPHKRGRHQ